MLLFVAVACRPQAKDPGAQANGPATNLRQFVAQGIVRELKSADQTVVIEHQAISNYMAAMTMPFKVREPKELAGLQRGDEISFRLLVTQDESWIDQITRTGERTLTPDPSPIGVPLSHRMGEGSGVRVRGWERATGPSRHPLLDYEFTNELGQAISLSQFRGQALAITFFFTRCPIPDFCPRLSKNFEEAVQKLRAMPEAPTNWHFLSVSFDSEFDTPAVLRAYAEGYHYDPRRWSFLTGPADKITELARLSDVTVERQGDFFNHNFRTLIIDATGQLQMSFPIGGNLSDAIVGEMLKAAAVTNR